MFTQLNRIKSDIENLSIFNSTPGRGVTRLSFTEEDKMAREYIKNQMSEAGLNVYTDAAGTVIGRLDGSLKNAPVIMVGSHFDSVKNGGCFDGAAGVVAALEVARTISGQKIKLKYPIEFVAMIEEEGTRFGGALLGSMAMAGKISSDDLELYKDSNGVSLAEAMKNFGLYPDRISDAARKPEDIKAFLELHIEQGPILEAGSKDVGIVEYIVGIDQYEITINGRPDHAGTTPMDMRADALDCAASVISKISMFAKEAGEGTVATVGLIKALPGAANIIPGQVVFTVDIRSRDAKCIKQVVGKIKDSLGYVSEHKGLSISMIPKLNADPVKMSDSIVEVLDNNSKKLGFASQKMISGAGHDAMIMADIAETGMVFVKSRGGRSHCPEEWTDYEDLQKGIELLYEAVLEIGERI